jgi:hypothetical protein
MNFQSKNFSCISIQALALVMFSPFVFLEGEGITAIEYGGSTIDKKSVILLNRIREFASFSVKPMNNCDEVASSIVKNYEIIQGAQLSNSFILLTVLNEAKEPLTTTQISA